MSKGYLQDISWVDFYGRPIVTCYSDEVGYVVPMKHIVEEHLGLNWDSAKDKMKGSVEIPVENEGDRSDPIEMTTVSLYDPVIVSGYDLSEGMVRMEHEYPDDDIPQFNPSSDYLCLPIKQLNLFLAQINIRKVSPEVREQLYVYQTECAAALHDYWFRGFSVNNRKDPSRISSERHEWCPREMATKSLEKGCARYSAYAQRQHDSRVNPEEILQFCKDAIYQLLDIESEHWDNQEGAVAFTLAFMERAAFDILYFAIEANVAPEDLQEILERNIQNAWENMGTLILSVQSPYTPFPGVGRGSARELV